MIFDLFLLFFALIAKVLLFLKQVLWSTLKNFLQKQHTALVLSMMSTPVCIMEVLLLHVIEEIL